MTAHHVRVSAFGACRWEAEPTAAGAVVRLVWGGLAIAEFTIPADVVSDLNAAVSLARLAADLPPATEPTRAEAIPNLGALLLSELEDE